MTDAHDAPHFDHFDHEEFEDEDGWVWLTLLLLTVSIVVLLGWVRDAVGRGAHWVKWGRRPPQNK